VKQARTRASAMTRGLGVALTCVLGAACSSGGGSSPAPIPLDSTAMTPRSRVVASECTSGQMQDCSVTLGVEEGVLHCYHGQMVCAEGAWGSCSSGEMSSMPPPGEALQGTEGCTENPCDPSCHASNVPTQTYDSDCDEDTRVQWGFFTYETKTPDDSSVRFRIRTANTEDALAAAQWIDLATAHASPNTQRCSMGGPAPCPIDLYNVLGGTNAPAVHHELAQVAVTLTPSSDQQAVATVQGWHLDYSCPFLQ
jgi:hypothetical protein